MQFIQNAAYQPIFGFPVIGYLGILSYLLLISAAMVMVLTRRRIVKIPPKYHFRLAYLTIIAATIHGVMALAVYV